MDWIDDRSLALDSSVHELALLMRLAHEGHFLAARGW